MRENPNTNRREAVEKLVTAAGGKLVEMYGTMAEGPGATAIFDAYFVAAGAITGVAASTDGLRNVKSQRLFSGDEVQDYPAKARADPRVLQAARSIRSLPRRHVCRRC